jgi:hypothetical protein
LITASTHGRSGIGRWFMGSVATVVRHSNTLLTVALPGCRTDGGTHAPRSKAPNLGPADASTILESIAGECP